RAANDRARVRAKGSHTGGKLPIINEGALAFQSVSEPALVANDVPQSAPVTRRAAADCRASGEPHARAGIHSLSVPRHDADSVLSIRYLRMLYAGRKKEVRDHHNSFCFLFPELGDGARVVPLHYGPPDRSMEEGRELVRGG